MNEIPKFTFDQLTAGLTIYVDDCVPPGESRVVNARTILVARDVFAELKSAGFDRGGVDPEDVPLFASALARSIPHLADDLRVAFLPVIPK